MVWLCTVTSDLFAGSMDVCSKGVSMVGVVPENVALDAVCDTLDETCCSLVGIGMVYHTVLLECGCHYPGGFVGWEVWALSAVDVGFALLVGWVLEQVWLLVEFGKPLGVEGLLVWSVGF